MVLFGKDSTVVPEDFAVYHDAKGGFIRWVRTHQKTAIAIGIFAVLGLLTAIIVPSVCLTVGCTPAKPQAPPTKYAPTRLIVAFLDDTDLEQVIPPILKSFYQNAKMKLSNIQIADFDNEDILQAALTEIRKYTSLEFVIRDFTLNAPKDPPASKRRHFRRVMEDLQPGGQLRRRLSQSCQATTQNPTDPLVSQQWYLNNINIQGAWNQSNTGRQDIIIAVTDSGAQLDHPDLQGAFWTNPGEIPGNGIDDDGNGIIDDVNGAVFSGKACSPRYAASNNSNCGNPNDLVGHGTKIAGIIAGQANCAGILGAGPGLKVMVLKVTDETINPFDPPYPFSDIVRAVDYGVGNGARIFSMSFGNNAQSDMQSYFKAELDRAANAYRDLFRKYQSYGTLFLAAAGNEFGNLDVWKANDYTYSPCMVDSPNVLCVGGTMPDNSVLFVMNGNSPGGSNYGTSTVDMGAPSIDMLTTVIGSGHDRVAGTSYATPLTAAVAGLVQGVVGLTSEGNGSAAAVKNILMGSGDYFASLPFRTQRKLNASRAIASAIAFVSNGTLLMNRFAALDEIVPVVRVRTFNVSYYLDTDNDGRFEIAAKPLVDNVAMDGRIQQLVKFKFTAGYMVIATAMMQFSITGLYGVKLAAVKTDLTRYQIKFGEMAFAGTGAFLQVTQPGWYRFEVYGFPESAASSLTFTFTTPHSSVWGPLNDTFITISTERPWVADYVPPSQPLTKLWHVTFNETNTTSWPAEYMQTFVPNSAMQHALALPEFITMNPVSVRTVYFPDGYSSSFTTIIGTARTHFRPMKWNNAAYAFWVSCTNCRLFINDQMIAENINAANSARISQCINLADNFAHEVTINFISSIVPNTIGPLAIRMGKCIDGRTAPSLRGFGSTSTFVGNPYFLRPLTTVTYQRGMRCNLYPFRQLCNPTCGYYGARPNATEVPAYSFTFPRDCLPNNRVVDPMTGITECRIRYAPTTQSSAVAANRPYFHRCWTYWDTGLTGGLGRVIPGTLPAFIWLAGRQVVRQPSDDGINPLVMAPMLTSLGTGNMQLAVFEGLSSTGTWAPGVTFIVLNGNLTSDFNSASLMTTASNSMFIPSNAR